MGFDRRSFLKAAGLTVAGLSAGWGVKAAIAGTGKTLVKPDPRALKAKRWGMVIDPQACLKAEGCTKCYDACDKTHNIPHFEDKQHEVKWIWREEFEHAFPSREPEYNERSLAGKEVTVLCNHCDSPPCVRVCPTKATFRREDGIVMMDMHRCIGCRFCMAACPYGSRSFNWLDPRPHIQKVDGKYPSDFPTRMKGVVEKCTFCSERIDVGETPACVEACEHKALAFGDMEDPNSDVRRILANNFSIRRKPELGTSPQVFYIV